MSNVWPGEAGVRESTSNERRPRGADGLADWPGSASPRVDAGKPRSLKTVGRYRGNGATTTVSNRQVLVKRSSGGLPA